MKKVEIKINFDHNQSKDTGSSISIFVDGQKQDIVTMDEHIKLRCISELDKWYDTLYDDLMK